MFWVSVKSETVSYMADGTSCEGYVCFDDRSKAKKPAVIVAHAWMGQDDFARKKAQELAKMGYVGFAADVYGAGKQVKTNEEATKLMLPLFLNRPLLRQRILAAFDTVTKMPFVDEMRIGAIGFCFGGLTVLELLLSGAKVKGVVSFHGVLKDRMGDAQAKLAPTAKTIHGALLALHGARDPMVSLQDIAKLEQELTASKINWEVDVYSQAAHAFTNPEAHEEASGLVYEPKTAARSWNAMQHFFEEIFA